MRGYDYWIEKSKNYPFHRQTLTSGEGSFDPAAFEAKYGRILRVPVPEEGVIFWGFETEAAVQNFDIEFPGATKP